MSESDEALSLQDGAIALTAVFVSLCIAISMIWMFKYICCPTTRLPSSTELRIHNAIYDTNQLTTPATTTSASSSSDHPIFPFSTKVRGMFLETVLEHETFHPKSTSRKGDDGNNVKFDLSSTSFVGDAAATVNPEESERVANVSNTKTHGSDSNETGSSVPPDDVRADIVSGCDTSITRSIRSLRSFRRNSSSSNNLDSSNTDYAYCAICYESLHDGDDVTTSNCDKTFHRTCIIQWLMQHDTCPYCRNTFKNINNKDIVANNNFSNITDTDLNAIMNCE